MTRPDGRRGTALLLAALIATLAACGADSPAELLRQARAHLARGEAPAATIQLKNALQQQPELAEARFLLGQTLLGQGDAASATVELRKALALKHPPAEVLPVLARALLAQREPKKLSDEFATTELPGAAGADLKTSLAEAWSAQGEAERAEAALAAALRAQPGFAPALLLQARLDGQRGRYPAAFEGVARVLAQDPGNAEAWALLGSLRYAGQADAAGAIEAYRKALALKPTLVTAHAGIAALLIEERDWAGAQAQVAALRKALPQQPVAPYFEMVLAFQRRDFKSARDLGQGLLRSHPDNLRVLQLMGATELESGHLLAAEAHLGKALQAAPEQEATRRLLVQTWLRSGQHAKAQAALAPLLARPAPDAELLALAAQAQLQAGDARQAEALFARAAALDPKDIKSRSALALGRLAQGHVDAAVLDLRALAASDSGSYADLALIAALSQRGRFDAALTAIDAFEHKQAGPWAAQLRGQVLLARKNPAEARKAFEAALAADAAYLPAAASLAALDLAEHRPEAAGQRFQRVLDKDPKNLQALLALAELKQRAGGSRDEVAALLAEAIKAHPLDPAPRLRLIEFHLAQTGPKRSDSSALALAAAQDALARLPDEPVLLDALGRVQLARGDYSQALVGFSKLAALLPDSPQPQLRLAGTYVAMKDDDNAIRSLKRALAIKPRLSNAERGLAALMLDAQRPEDALALARELRARHPQDAAGAVLEGDIEASRQHWEAALKAYRSGLTLAGGSQAARGLQHALQASGQAAEAERQAAAWLREHPQDSGFRMFLGDTALTRQRLPEAERHYRAVLQAEPANALALNNLAWVRARLKQPDALALAEKLNALAPGQPAFIDTLAMILAETDQLPKAISLQQGAVDRAPDNGSFRLNLARLYLQSGDKAAARGELDRLAAMGERFPAQAEVATLRKTL